MKYLFLLIGLFGIQSVLFAQKEKWKEMEDFHGIISMTFHPAEENNLQPVKDSAAVLLSKAKTWEKSVVPPGFNSQKTKSVLKRLSAECAAIVAAVKRNKPDAELKTMITKAHDSFHEIAERCRE